MLNSTALFKGCVCVLVTQSCPIPCDPMNCILPVSSVRGILQARILEWVAIPFSRRSSRPRIEPVSPASPALAGGLLIPEPPEKPLLQHSSSLSPEVFPHSTLSSSSPETDPDVRRQDSHGVTS